MNKDIGGLAGRFKIEIFDNGKLVQSTGWIKNVITNVGKAASTGLLGNTGGYAAFTYLAVGTSGTAPAAADTTLGAEITDTGLARSSATVSQVTTTVANDTLQLTHTWTATGAKTIQEIGILNASSVGNLLAHGAISPSITTANGNQVVGTYQVKQA